MLKSQVLRGGAGKAGLIRVIGDAETGKREAGELFASAHNVRMLLVEQAVDIAREIYLSITVDPVTGHGAAHGLRRGGRGY